MSRLFVPRATERDLISVGETCAPARAAELVQPREMNYRSIRRMSHPMRTYRQHSKNGTLSVFVAMEHSER